MHSPEEYQEQKNPDEISYSNIEIGVGLNQVDNLKPSKHFYEVIDKCKKYEDAENELKKYHVEQGADVSPDEMECDIVALRIARLIENRAFAFSPLALKHIHKELFADVFSDATLAGSVGAFRNINIMKEEEILCGKTVQYAQAEMILELLEYDFEREKRKNYAAMTSDKLVQNIADFTSRIWQVHPFREGNTRTTAVFMIQYLQNKGFAVNNDLFREHSKYFRNALVLSNFDDIKAKISPTFQYLNSFFEKLLVDDQIQLQEIVNPYKSTD